MNKRKHHILFFMLSLYLFFPLQAKAESGGIGVEISYLYPNRTKEMGFTFKPSMGYALNFKSSNELKFRWGFMAGFYPFKTRMDEFPIYGYDSEKIYPGVQSFKNNRMYMIPFAFTTEFKILNTAFSPFIGLDFRIPLVTYTYYSQVEEAPFGGGGSGESMFEASFDFFPKAGLVYDYKSIWSFLLTAGYNWSLHPKDANPYASVSLSAVYYLP